MKDFESDRISKYLYLINEYDKPTYEKGDNLYELVDEIEKIRSIEKIVKNEYLVNNFDPDWAEVGIHYEDPYMYVLRDAIVFQKKHAKIHHRVCWKNGRVSGVVMLTRFKEKIVFVKHFRHAIQKYSLELPRGGIEKDLSISDLIYQEIKDEVGGEISKISELPEIHLCNSLLNTFIAVYEIELKSFNKPEKKEGISEILLLNYSEIKKYITSGIINDAITICAISRKYI